MPNEGITRLKTGVRNLDDLLGGGLPTGSVTVIAGPPGSGKTTLAQEICFQNASPERSALCFNTLSEPTAKTLQYHRQFEYFDPAKVNSSVRYVDLGTMARSKGLEEAAGKILEHIERVKPAIVVIDSFKVFDDLAASQAELRRFSYELAVHLMAWECTAFLIGEYPPEDFQANPLFSVIDGLVLLTQSKTSGEQQRFFQIVKMRGTDHSRDEYPFIITKTGIEIFAPRVTIERARRADPRPAQRSRTGIEKLDDLLGEGIPLGSSLLVGGVAGTGKTVLSLEVLYRGALQGERGVIFSFEETPERLRAAARGFGWDFDREVDRGLIDIVFIPQPAIQVERDLLMMQERIAKTGARRVAIDSVSVFLHKIKDPQVAREKVFQLASIIQNHQAIGFFATDIPYGADTLSRFGVEETVIDGVILLSSEKEGRERHRYLEVYKLRNTAHLKGEHAMTIGPGGITVFPRYRPEVASDAPPSPIGEPRVASGVAALDALLGGGLRERSVTLVSGSAGIGKTTLAVQFVLAGAARKERSLYVSLEEGPAQIQESAAGLGLPLKAAVAGGLVDLTYLSRTRTRADQLLALLGDKLERGEFRRIVLDSASHLAGPGLTLFELRRLLFDLAARFKALGVTSFLTLEASAIMSLESVTEEQGLSPVADNLIALRYRRTARGLERTLTIVKARASRHDQRIHSYTLGEGGVTLGPPIGEPQPEARDEGRP